MISSSWQHMHILQQSFIKEIPPTLKCGTLSHLNTFPHLLSKSRCEYNILPVRSADQIMFLFPKTGGALKQKDNLWFLLSLASFKIALPTYFLKRSHLYFFEKYYPEIARNVMKPFALPARPRKWNVPGVGLRNNCWKAAEREGSWRLAGYGWYINGSTHALNPL